MHVWYQREASDRSRDAASWAGEDFGSRSRQLQAHLYLQWFHSKVTHLKSAKLWNSCRMPGTPGRSLGLEASKAVCIQHDPIFKMYRSYSKLFICFFIVSIFFLGITILHTSPRRRSLDLKSNPFSTNIFTWLTWHSKRARNKASRSDTTHPGATTSCKKPSLEL